MRVCVVAEYYPRPHDPVSGVWAHRQALAVRAAGADVRVLALERPLPPLATLRRGPLATLRWLRQAASLPRRTQLDGVEIEYVRYLSPPRSSSYARWHTYARRSLEQALERLHERWPFDLVHAHYALPAGAAARAFARRRGMPLAVSVHGGDILDPLLARPAARAAVGAVLRSASVVLCNSRFTAERAAQLAGVARVTVVHLGTDIPREQPAKAPAPTLCTLAHVVPRKRHTDVLEAIALLGGERPAWRVIGDGPALEPLLQRAAALGVAIDACGQLPPAQALDELGRSHLMVMPSVDEAFGVAYVEALARGVPAIGCAGEGGPEEIAALGDGMLLAPPRDPPALAAAIQRGLSERVRLASAARETAERHFSWAATGAATLAAFEGAL